MKTISVADTIKLSVSERIQLVKEIWDSIATDPEAVPVTAAHKRELNRRLATHRKHPNAGSPWVEVKKRIRANR